MKSKFVVEVVTKVGVQLLFQVGEQVGGWAGGWSDKMKVIPNSTQF